MDFIYLFRVLLKRKWIIIASGLLAAALAYLLTQNQEKQYLSSSRLATGYITSERIQIGGEENASNYMESENKFNNAVVSLTSPSVLSLVSYNLMLNDLTSGTPFRKLSEDKKAKAVYKDVNPEAAKNLLKEKLQTMTMLSSSKPEERKLLEYINLHGYDLKTLRKHLNVYRFERSDYMQIDFDSENPELSAFVVNDVYQQFMRYNGELNRVYSKEAIDTLRGIMDKKKNDFDIKVLNARNQGYSYSSDAVDATLATAGELEKTLAVERAKKTQNEIDLRKVNQRLKSMADVSDNSEPGNYNSEIIAAQKARDQAYEAYLKNPSDAALNAHYQQLKKEYESLVRKAGSTSPTRTIGSTPMDRQALLDQKSDLEYDIQANNSIIGSLQQKIRILQGEATSKTMQGATAETVKNELEMAEKDYLAAKQNYNNAIDQGRGQSINNFKQVIIGQPAIEPEQSKRGLIVALAGIAAAVTTMLIIIFLTYLDSSIKTPIIFSKSVNLKLMSMVNFMDLRNKNLADIVANRDNADNTHDRSKFNAFRESIRKLRYEIESTGKKVFLFTSTKKGQGKTTLIQALSYSMSLSKKKILIIDTNFCNNDLTVQLNADPILEKIVPNGGTNPKMLVDQIKGYSKDIGVGSVFAIGSEGGDYTPSEILPRENLLHHLKELTSEFDYIFLEGPPLNDFSDSKELAQYVEGVIAVFSAQHIIKQIDKQSIGFFKELDGKFCGSILNMVDLKNVTLV